MRDLLRDLIRGVRRGAEPRSPISATIRVVRGHHHTAVSPLARGSSARDRDIAFRGAIARADLRQVIAATYHQVWWPDTATVRYDGDRLPVWHEATSRYLDPATGELLPTWDQALDAIGPDAQPVHAGAIGSA